MESRTAKRQWRKWGLSYASHWATGAVLGFAMAYGDGYEWAGGGGLALVLAYQLGEYWKYGDTVALDLKDYGIGYAVGAVGGTLCRRLLS